MSICYIFDGDVSETELRAAMKKCDVVEQITDDTTDNEICLTQDGDYIWFFMSDNIVGSVTKYGRGGDGFLYELAQELKVKVYCEYDDEFYDVLNNKECDTGLVSLEMNVE